MVKGMNQYKKLSERQEATKKCLAEELEKLVNDSYNPFNRVNNATERTQELLKVTPLVEALKLANQE